MRVKVANVKWPLNRHACEAGVPSIVTHRFVLLRSADHWTGSWEPLHLCIFKQSSYSEDF
jgi:hypothetical protein